VVEAVGTGVTDIRVGDRVGYLTGPQGAYAQARVMPAEVLIPLPDGISDRTAATLAMKGMTAHICSVRSIRCRAVKQFSITQLPEA
jgi:NADPH2:quinone reductase